MLSYNLLIIGSSLTRHNTVCVVIVMVLHCGIGGKRAKEMEPLSSEVVLDFLLVCTVRVCTRTIFGMSKYMGEHGCACDVTFD